MTMSTIGMSLLSGLGGKGGGGADPLTQMFGKPEGSAPLPALPAVAALVPISNNSSPAPAQAPAQAAPAPVALTAAPAPAQAAPAQVAPAAPAIDLMSMLQQLLGK